MKLPFPLSPGRRLVVIHRPELGLKVQLNGGLEGGVSYFIMKQKGRLKWK